MQVRIMPIPGWDKPLTDPSDLFSCSSQAHFLPHSSDAVLNSQLLFCTESFPEDVTGPLAATPCYPALSYFKSAGSGNSRVPVLLGAKQLWIMEKVMVWLCSGIQKTHIGGTGCQLILGSEWIMKSLRQHLKSDPRGLGMWMPEASLGKVILQDPSSMFFNTYYCIEIIQYSHWPGTHQMGYAGVPESPRNPSSQLPQCRDYQY